MRSSYWVLAAALVVTASALAWRTTPEPLAGEPIVIPPPAHAGKRTPGLHPLPAAVRWAREPISRALHPAVNPLDQDEPILAVLPSDTTFVAAVERCRDVFDMIGLEQLLATYGTEVKELETWLGGLPGVEPFDPATWGATGVSLEGPGGFAVVGFDENAVLVLFADVADPEAVVRTAEGLFALEDRAMHRSDLEPVDGLPNASILTPTTEDGEADPTPELAIVLRGRRAMLVTRLNNA